MDSDKPYLLDTGAGEIVELPVHWSLDDWEQYAYLPDPPLRSSIESPEKVLDLWTSELDAMRRYGCLFVLTCHPFLSGRPHRVEVLRRLIEHALTAGDVEFVGCGEAARRSRADDGLQRRILEPVVVEPGLYRFARRLATRGRDCGRRRPDAAFGFRSDVDDRAAGNVGAAIACLLKRAGSYAGRTAFASATSPMYSPPAISHDSSGTGPQLFGGDDSIQPFGQLAAPVTP